MKKVITGVVAAVIFIGFVALHSSGQKLADKTYKSIRHWQYTF